MPNQSPGNPDIPQLLSTDLSSECSIRPIKDILCSNLNGFTILRFPSFSMQKLESWKEVKRWWGNDNFCWDISYSCFFFHSWKVRLHEVFGTGRSPLYRTFVTNGGEPDLCLYLNWLLWDCWLFSWCSPRSRSYSTSHSVSVCWASWEDFRVTNILKFPPTKNWRAMIGVSFGNSWISGTPSETSRCFMSRTVQGMPMESVRWIVAVGSRGSFRWIWWGSSAVQTMPSLGGVCWGLTSLYSRYLRALNDQSQKSTDVCSYCNVFPVDFLSLDIE